MFTKGEEKRSEILGKALQMFNKAGIEYVGVREIAAALDLRPSHVTYYFPTKEDLILALAQELHDLNERSLDPAGSIRDMRGFIDRFRQVLLNHIAYRGLILSMPHLILQLPKMRGHLKRSQQARRNDLRTMIEGMVSEGVLKELSDEDLDYLIGSCSLMSRGWLADCSIGGHQPKTRIPHYLGMLKQHFKPYILK